jgi:hypothetical protein
MTFFTEAARLAKFKDLGLARTAPPLTFLFLQDDNAN